MGRQPPTSQADLTKTREAAGQSDFLKTGGATIRTSGSMFLHLDSGTRVALSGVDMAKKHYFCDWILGFANISASHVEIEVRGRTMRSPMERQKIAGVLGRSPLLYGETIQESLLYRTHNVRKVELYAAIERFYGPSLREKTSPLNPLIDPNGKPIPTHILTAREHLEIGQINLILQKVPLIILDLSSDLMRRAIDEGFRPCAELADSGKTILLILPPERDATWAEELMGCRLNASLEL